MHVQSIRHASRRGLTRCLAATVCVALALGMGCSPSSEKGDADGNPFYGHDHDLPETRPSDYGAGVQQLHELHRLVLAEISHNDLDDAREVIETIRETLQWLPEVAGDSDMPEAQWNRVYERSPELQAWYAEWSEHLASSGASAVAPRETIRKIESALAELAAIEATGSWRDSHRGEEPVSSGEGEP